MAWSIVSLIPKKYYHAFPKNLYLMYSYCESPISHVINNCPQRYVFLSTTPRIYNKSFCCINIMLYFCTHERKHLASFGKYHSYAPTHNPHTPIGSLHPYSLALQDYPKTLSAINLAGKSKPAIKYLLRVCGSFHIRYTKRRFVLSTQAG